MSSGFLYQSLENWLLHGIKQKRWRAGEKLPSIRALCAEKQLSKATVMHALQRLEAQGLIEARPKAGYFVKYQPEAVVPPAHKAEIEAPRMVGSGDLLLDIMQRSAAFDLCPNPGGEQQSQGITELNRCIGRALREPQSGHHSYYGDPAGSVNLRQQITLHYGRRGLQLGIDEVCITSGCQHALFLALMACCAAGDTVAVESPGFYGVLQLLEQLRLKVVEIPSNPASGMDIKALEKVLQRWPVKACIVSPAFATPTGAVMPEDAGRHLIRLANQYDLAIIEDDIYADTALAEMPDPLKAMDTDNRVILCSSLSKCLSRDIRLGWVSGGRWHTEISRLKLVTQLSSSFSIQEGVAQFMAEGRFLSHLRRQRNLLQHNRDQLIAELQSWNTDIKFTLPRGGLAIWVEFPSAVDTLSHYQDLLAQGIIITPGTLFSISGRFKNCLRLSYCHSWDERRRNALTRLSEMLT